MANRDLKFVKPDTPAFLQKFKERVGYKEAPDITTKQKKQELEQEDEDLEREDEKPTVVVLKDGDLSQEEAAKYGDELKESLDNVSTSSQNDQEEVAADGKITFKKPKKRKEDIAGLNVTSSKHERKRKKAESKMKSVKNNSLLSFGEDEDEES